MKNFTLSFIFTLITILCTITDTHAQESSSRFGIKAGINTINLNSAPANYEYQLGFQVGAYFKTELSKNLVFTPQALFTQKGGNVNIKINSISLTGTKHISYIDVPLLLGFKATSSLLFYFGPQISFLLSPKTNVKVFDVTIPTAYDPGLKSVVMGGNLGTGYKFSNNVGIDLNYMFDVSRAVENVNDPGKKNKGFVLSLAYTF